MAAKSAIRDTARVLDLPLFEADKIAKLIPNAIPSKWSLARFLKEAEAEIENSNSILLKAKDIILSETSKGHKKKIVHGKYKRFWCEFLTWNWNCYYFG